MLTFALLSLVIFMFWRSINSMSEGPERDSKENKYVNILFWIIVLLAAFRSELTGADTPGYMREYGEMTRFEWGQIAERFEGYSMYYYMSKVFSVCHMPLFVWFGFVQFVYLYAMKRLIDKYSKDKLMSMMTFVSMGLFTFSLAGLKQVIAMALLMYAYLYLTERKSYFSLILIVLAYLCHSTALIFLPAFGLYFLPSRKYYWALILTAVLVLAFYGGELLMGASLQYAESTGNEHFSSYLDFENNHSPVMLIYYVCMILFCIPGFKKFHADAIELFNLSLGFCMICAALQVLAFFSPHAFRFAYYYLPFYMVLVPTSYHSMNAGTKKTMGFVIMFSLIFYFLYVNRDYIYSMAFIM